MEVSIYAEEDAAEEDHWWFMGRRRLFGDILRRLEVPKSAPILDAGTSGGTNLRMLRDAGFTNFRGLELSEQAIDICTRKGLGPIERGDVCGMPFPAAAFDFVLATDIIEHVDRDDIALSEVHRVLKPGGHGLITVPAFASLWGPHDEMLHHKRRYLREPLLRAVRAAGLTPVVSYYYNYLLFAPIWSLRWLRNRLRLTAKGETQINTPLINKVLYRIFLLDVMTAPLLKPAFGVSLLVLCRKDERPS